MRALFFLKKKSFIYLKETGGEKKIASKMYLPPAGSPPPPPLPIHKTARVGPGQNEDPGTSSRSPMCVQQFKHLDYLLLLYPDHQEGVGSEEKQPRLEPVLHYGMLEWQVAASNTAPQPARCHGLSFTIIK